MTDRKPRLLDPVGISPNAFPGDPATVLVHIHYEGLRGEKLDVVKFTPDEAIHFATLLLNVAARQRTR